MSNKGKITPEDRARILLPLLLPKSHGQRKDEAESILGQSDWLKAVGDVHLESAFFASLNEWGLLDKLRPEIKSKLESAYNENSVRLMIIQDLFAEVIKTISPLKNPALLLKGIGYSYELYSDPAARYVGDIDIMLGPDDTWPAIDKLTEKGYLRLKPPPKRGGLINMLVWAVGLGVPYQRMLLKMKGPQEEKETVFEAKAGGLKLLIEVHHGLINLRPGSGKEKVFHAEADTSFSTRPLTLDGIEVQVLDYEDAFIHALRHLALHHRFIGLRWHQDLALMLIKWGDKLDPDSLYAKFEKTNSTKILRVELSILEELFGSSLFKDLDPEKWFKGDLPFEYPFYRRVAFGGKRTPMRELVRTLLAPSWKEMIRTLF